MGFVPRMAFEGEDGETLRGLVGAGLGVALLAPSSHVTPGVVELRVTHPRTTRTVSPLTTCSFWRAALSACRLRLTAFGRSVLR